MKLTIDTSDPKLREACKLIEFPIDAVEKSDDGTAVLLTLISALAETIRDSCRVRSEMRSLICFAQVASAIVNEKVPADEIDSAVHRQIVALGIPGSATKGFGTSLSEFRDGTAKALKVGGVCITECR